MFVLSDLYNILSQELKAGLINGLLLIDFLYQSGPPVVGVDVQDAYKHTMFAEKLDDLRLHWPHLQRELNSQV